MAIDGEVIRTVFQTEWMGSGVVSNMIRQYGLAEKAINSLRGAQAKGAPSAQFVQDKDYFLQQKFTQGLRKLTDAFNEGRISPENAARAMGMWREEVFGAQQAVPGLLGGLSKTTIALGAVAAAVGVAVVAFKALYPVLEEGAKIQQLDESFRHLTTTMADGPGVLREMQEASKYTITTMAAQEGLMTLVAGSSREMTQELAAAAPKLLEISKAANKLNPALGDTNFMFTSLAKGVKRAEPRLIDNLGLKLRVSDANRTLAKELGKTVMELTAEEKQLALLNETLRAGEQLINQVGGSVEGTQDPFLRMSAATTEAKDALKAYYSEAINVGGVLDWLSQGLRNLADETRFMTLFNKAVEDGLDAVQGVQLYGGLSGPGVFGDPKEMERVLKAIEDEYVAIARLEEERLAGRQRTMDAWQEYFSPSATGRYGNMFLSGEEDDLLFKMAKNAELVADNIEDMTEEQEEAAEQFKKLEDAAIAWEKETNKRIQETREAWLEYKKVLTDSAIAAEKADAETSFFTTTVENMGTAWVEVGGRTKEQNELLEDLRDGYAKAEKNVRDYTVGLQGFGDEEDKVNEKIEENQAAMAHYATEIAALEAVHGDLQQVTTTAKWNWDNLKDAMANAAGEAGVGAMQYAQLKLSMGTLNEEQAMAIVMAAAVDEEMRRLARDIQLGKLDPSQAFGELEDFIGELERKEAKLRLSFELTPDAFADQVDETQPEFDARRFGDAGFEIGGSAAEYIRKGIEEELFGPGVFEPLEIEARALIKPAEDEIIGLIERYDGTVITVVVDADVPGGTGGGGVPDCPGGYWDPVRGRCVKDPGAAMGGTFGSGRQVLVGELGPEIITMPPGGGTVTPSNQSNIGSGSITQIFNNYSASAAAVSNALAQIESQQARRRAAGYG